MTCIIGMEYEGHVYIGGDSVSNNDWDKGIIAGKKVFHVGALLIGFSGHTRMQNLLQCEFEAREKEEHESDLEFAVKIVDDIRLLAKEFGFVSSSEGRDQLRGCSFLIGFNGGLYWVGYEFDVTRFADGIGAVGVGADFALGSLYAQRKAACAMEKGADVAETMLMRALDTAGHFSAAVAPPYYVQSI